ncbi:MAG: hypothetical protein P8Y73_03825, partial [Desulfuromonadales bacterium]
LAQIAGVLGRTEDARRYEQLAADIRAAFADAERVIAAFEDPSSKDYTEDHPTRQCIGPQ